MKHLQVYEKFGYWSPQPVITATGDWSRLVPGGTPLDWVHANTYEVTYHTDPTPEMLRRAQADRPEPDTIDPDQAVDDIMGGDQSGSYLLRSGEVIFPADPQYSPEDYRDALQQMVDEFNANPGGYESDACLTLLEDPEVELTPEFLSHCQAVVAGDSLSQRLIGQNPEAYSQYPEILPGGDRSRLALMKPRIELIYKVV